MEVASHASESDHELEPEFDEEDEDVVIIIFLIYHFRIFVNKMNQFCRQISGTNLIQFANECQTIVGTEIGSHIGKVQ